MDEVRRDNGKPHKHKKKKKLLSSKKHISYKAAPQLVRLSQIQTLASDLFTKHPRLPSSRPDDTCVDELDNLSPHRRILHVVLQCLRVALRLLQNALHHGIGHDFLLTKPNIVSGCEPQAKKTFERVRESETHRNFRVPHRALHRLLLRFVRSLRADRTLDLIREVLDLARVLRPRRLVCLACHVQRVERLCVVAHRKQHGCLADVRLDYLLSVPQATALGGAPALLAAGGGAGTHRKRDRRGLPLPRP